MFLGFRRWDGEPVSIALSFIGAVEVWRDRWPGSAWDSAPVEGARILANECETYWTVRENYTAVCNRIQQAGGVHV